MAKLKYSCIIAAFNESGRIGQVLTSVSQVEAFGEIICVDDGSTDDTCEIVQKHAPKVTLVKHKQNQGKAAAIYDGVTASRFENLVLIDADLLGLKPREITRAIYLFETNQLDCLIMLTGAMNEGYKLFRKIFRITACVAGDRVIKKQILLHVLKKKNLKSYQLEAEQNNFLMENNKRVASYELTAIDLGKTGKSGFVQGSLGEVSMWKQIIGGVGLASLIRQSLFFATKRLS